jgi:peptide deformylase
MKKSVENLKTRKITGGHRHPNKSRRKFHIDRFGGMKARIIQHEYDHIEGKLFTDYLSPLKRKLLNGKLTSISKGICDVPYKIKASK